MSAFVVVVVLVAGWLFAQWNHPRKYKPWTEQERMRW